MANVLIEQGTMDNIADAIRAKNGSSNTYKPAQMPTAISNLSPTPSLQSKSVSYTPSKTAQSGTVTADSGYDGLSSVAVSVNPIPSEYIIPSGSISIASNGTVDVTDYASAVVNISGGQSMNVQVDNSNHRISGTTYVNTGATLTVAVAGTYSIYWSAFRSSTSSGTNGTQLYKNDNSQWAAFTGWENSYAQTPKLTGVTLAKNDVLKVYARASSSSRYVCVGNLTIVQTS